MKKRLCGWAKASVMGTMTTYGVASAGGMARDAFLGACGAEVWKVDVLPDRQHAS